MAEFFEGANIFLEESKRFQALSIPKELVIEFHATEFDPDPRMHTSYVGNSRMKF